MRRLVSRLVSHLKGSPYELPADIPLSVLAELIVTRGVAALRALWVLRRLPRGLGGLVFIEPGVVVRRRRQLHLGRGATLARGVFVDAFSRNGVAIGSNVCIGAYTIIRASGVITAPGVGVTIGDNSGIGEFSFIGAAGGVRIGNDVIMGQRVGFHAENHVADAINRPIRLQGVTHQGIVVEDDVWVGAGVIFLDGAHVGRGSIVAAGAVVRGRFAPYAVIAGVPARVVRMRRCIAEAD